MHMKVTGFGTVSANSSVHKRRNTGSVGGFSDMLSAAETPETAHTGGLSEVSATPSMSSLLALQEISEEDVQRRKAVAQGHGMLDELEKLRRQLLQGGIPPQTLSDISRQLSLQKQQIMDPVLTAIIEDIELRTAVELAKLEMAAASQANIDSGAEF